MGVALGSENVYGYGTRERLRVGIRKREDVSAA